MTNIFQTHRKNLQTKNINGFDVQYIFKPNRKDSAHLVVMFNGYRNYGWDFENSINFLKCNILMIDDVFKDGQSCYLGVKQNFDFSDVVSELIQQVLDSLYLSKDDCTLLGASKGGFAALYIGLKYNFKNIVASTFVGKIGSWMVDYNKNIAKHVIGEYTEEIIQKYDELLFGLIEKDEEKNKNIYVFLSENDNYYLEYGQRDLIIEMNKKYTNINVFFTNSELSFQHSQVSSYFLQEILSVTTLLTKNIITKLNKLNIDQLYLNAVLLPSPKSTAIFKTKKSDFIKKINPINKFNKLYSEKGVLFLEGLAYLENFDSPSVHSLKKHLRLKNFDNDVEYEFVLGSVPKKELSMELYSDIYVDYTAATTATMGFNGIDLKSIPCGRYELMVSVSHNNSKSYKMIGLSFDLDQRGNDDNYDYRLLSQNKRVFLVKQKIINDSEQLPSFFKFEKIKYNQPILDLEGIFIVKGAEMSDFHLGNYYLTFKGNDDQQTVVLGKINKNGIGENVGNYFGGYRSCYFATMGLKGIDTSALTDKEYDIYITLAYKSEVFTYNTKYKLIQNNKGYVLSS